MFFKDRQVSVRIFVLCASKLTLAKKMDERGLDVSRLLAMRNEAKAVLTAISVVVVVEISVIRWCHASYTGILIVNGLIVSVVMVAPFKNGILHTVEVVG